ncbi:unnamed protein product [Bursaphelenchus okinawaensis]|uniref:Calcineurin-like phosphoesterase domain-containing protein n=1 Tax=Bursaphelenchus okinawaensis TaxID=465554 RepID=A0A811LAD0_9BILA|nr:unnamed protein product [Bursaphelenchus okinawaensis]CAG9120700.1 unnamed protein product [Bursaphelenchus okinawaensis]
MTSTLAVDSREQHPDKLWNLYWSKERDHKIVEERLPLNTPISDDKARIVCISDTHERLANILPKIPNGDILVHCGDFTNNGLKEKLLEFDQLMGSLPHPLKLVVAGNHELGFDDTEDESLRYEHDVGLGTKRGYELLKNVTVLHDKLVEVLGLKIYGASWHPLPKFPFYRARGNPILQEWLKVPANIDVLLTHTPPLGHQDQFNDIEGRWGCAELLQVVEKVAKPKLHVFGHVHEQNGVSTNGVTTFVNASICSHKLETNYDPLIFDLPLNGSKKDYSITVL